ncbi:DMT family transporter [Ahrensia kielensis]|uniref:DMT family transporter n=1 Tax=Ahrensia kielensis TaxID=76980 RepID=UPI000378FFE9|nr:DMT family transporter [Ahrensia kielensis]
MSKPTINSSMTTIEWVMLITLSVVFGGSFFFVGVIVQDMPPKTIVFFRVLIAALALHLFMRVTGRKIPWTGTAWFAFFAMGLLNNVIPFSLIVWGQTQIASGVASILNATTPLFTVMIAHALTTDEKLTITRVSGIVAGFIGVAIMIGGGAIADGAATALAQIACIGAAISYGFASVFGKRFKGMTISPYAVATGQVTASTIMMFPIMMIFDQPWTLSMPSTQSIFALLALGLISSAFAYILFFSILDGAGATNLSLVTFLVPVSAIFLGIVFLGEILLPRHLAGLGLIIVGLILVDGRVLKRRVTA